MVQSCPVIMTMRREPNVPVTKKGGCAVGEMPLILTPTEAAAMLRIGRSSIYRLLRGGELASLRIGRKIVIPQRAVELYIRENLCYYDSNTKELEPVQKGDIGV